MSDKHIAILAGTLEIHQPLYRSLSKHLDVPVHLITERDPDKIRDRLGELSAQAQIWAFPSNELTLNLLFEALKGCQLLTKGQVVIPGTARILGSHTAHELSDKAQLRRMLRETQFSSFSVLRTEIVRFACLKEAVQHLSTFDMPIILKPAQKDAQDSFTRAFPEKLAVITDAAQFSDYFTRFGAAFWNREFIVQELSQGTPISWCGYFADGESIGYCIEPMVKSPVQQLGGTTTLAKLKPVSGELERAVRELASVLMLDGVFEIEFISRPEGLAFFYEINPRPWLQVSLLLDQTPNIFLTYLRQKGFALQQPPSQRKSCHRWGSAIRYISLNQDRATWNLATLLTTLRHDVRLSGYFTLGQRLRYLRDICHLVLIRTLRDHLTPWLSRGK